MLPSSSVYVLGGHISHTGIFSVKPTPLAILERSISVEMYPFSQLTVVLKQFYIHNGLVIESVAYSKVDSQS